MGIGVESETHRDIPAEFRAVREWRDGVENVDDSGYEKKARLHVRFVDNWEEESKLGFVGDEVSQAVDAANESKPKGEFEDNL